MNRTTPHLELAKSVKIEPLLHPTLGITGLRVTRDRRSIYYHRTDRSLEALFLNSDSEFRGFFERQSFFQRSLMKQSWLDVGCGGGQFVRSLQQLGAEAIGLDLFFTPKQEGAPGFFLGDAYLLPFRAESFQNVLASWSIFHFEPLSCLPFLLRQMYRVLAPGGVLWIPCLDNVDRLRVINRSCREFGFNAQFHPESASLRIQKF